MDRLKGFWNKFTEQTDLPGEIFPGESVVELAGDRRILVENHRGVTEYGCDRICIRLPSGILTVCGSKLSLSRMTKKMLVITGMVDCVSLQRGKKL